METCSRQILFLLPPYFDSYSTSMLINLLFFSFICKLNKKISHQKTNFNFQPSCLYLLRLVDDLQTPNSPDLNPHSPHQNMHVQCMGILVQYPPFNYHLSCLSWIHTVVGFIFDTSPPSSSFVFTILNNTWETR